MNFSTPERDRTQQTSNSARDEILTVAAFEAALAVAPAADLARLTADDLTGLASMIRFDVQTTRLRSY